MAAENPRPGPEGGEAAEKRARLRVERGWLTDKQLVAVVGGGIGGLALALALQRAGLRARVFERDSAFDQRRQGYGLTLSTTNAALASLDLLEELRRRDVPSRAHWVFGADGEIMGYFGNAFSHRTGPLHERGNLRVPRQVLRKMLLDRLAPGTVEWGRQLVSYSEAQPATKGSHREGEDGADGKPAAVTLRFASGEVVEAAALVGADGIHSQVRVLRGSAVKPSYIGVLAVVGITRSMHPLLHEAGFYTLDGTRRLFTMPFGDSGGVAETMWQLSIAMPEQQACELASLSNSDLLMEIQCQCQSWHEPVPTMLRETEPSAIWAAPMRDAPPPPPPPKGSGSVVTVLGDAAHPMGMFKGQGANTALSDAVAVARWLTQRPIRPALACYEREMIAKAGPRVQASREAAVALHSSSVMSLAKTKHPFSGVPAELHMPLRQALKQTGVTAAAAIEHGALEAAVAKAIHNLEPQK